MSRAIKHMTTCFAAAALVAWIVTGFAPFGHAADANAQDESGGHGNGGQVASQPESSSSVNVGGCWDGTGVEGDLYDEWVGDGIGWIGFVQHGASLKGGKKGSYYEFVWENGDYAYGAVSGTADADGFQATASAGGKCKVSLVGAPYHGYIYGVYGVYSCGSFDFHVGLFEFEADPSGCANIVP